MSGSVTRILFCTSCGSHRRSLLSGQQVHDGLPASEKEIEPELDTVKPDVFSTLATN